MPFFFFVSGIVFSIKYDFKVFFSKRWKTLVMPYFYFSAIVAAGLWLCGDLDLPSMWRIMINGWGGIALWFIPVLFFTQLVWLFIARRFARWQAVFVILAMALLGWLSSWFVVGCPYNLLLVFTSMAYFGIGSLSKRFLVRYYERAGFRSLVLCLAASFLLSFAYLLNGGRPVVYATNELGYGLPTIISGIAGSVMVCTLVNIFLKAFGSPAVALKMFSYAGKNSYVILAFHQLLLTYCYLYLHPFISNYVAYKLVELAVVALGCIVLIELINRRLPWLVGRRRVEK